MVRFAALRRSGGRNEAAWKGRWNEQKQTCRSTAAVACIGPGGPATAPFSSKRRPSPGAGPRTAAALPSSRPAGGGAEYPSRASFDFGPLRAVPERPRRPPAPRPQARRPPDLPGSRPDVSVLGQRPRDGDGGRGRLPVALRRVQIAAALHRAVELDPDRERAPDPVPPAVRARRASSIWPPSRRGMPALRREEGDRRRGRSPGRPARPTGPKG